MFLQDRKAPPDLLQPLCDLLFTIYREKELQFRQALPPGSLPHMSVAGSSVSSSCLPSPTSTCRAVVQRGARYFTLTAGYFTGLKDYPTAPHCLLPCTVIYFSLFRAETLGGYVRLL